MLPVLLFLPDGLLGLSATLIFSPLGILAPVRLPNQLQMCQPGSSILSPTKASQESCGTLDELTRMQASSIHRLLNWFSSWSRMGPQIVIAVFLDDSWTANIWYSVALCRLLHSQLLYDDGQHSSSFALEPYVIVPLLPGSHPVTWMWSSQQIHLQSH